MWRQVIQQSLQESEISSKETKPTNKYFYDLIQLNNLMNYIHPKKKIIPSKFSARSKYSSFSSFSRVQFISYLSLEKTKKLDKSHKSPKFYKLDNLDKLIHSNKSNYSKEEGFIPVIKINTLENLFMIVLVSALCRWGR